MYDELINRLREAPDDWPDAELHYQAADAIEELIKRVPSVPHGRLIDADNIGLTNFEIILCQKGNPFKNALEMLLEKIESAPTIIPAEPPKEET